MFINYNLLLNSSFPLKYQKRYIVTGTGNHAFLQKVICINPLKNIFSSPGIVCNWKTKYFKKSLFCRAIALKVHQRFIVTFMVGKAHILLWNRLKKPSQIENDFQFHINPNFIIRNKALCWKQPPSSIFYYHPMLSLCNILK